MDRDFFTNHVPFAEPVATDTPRSGDNAAATEQRRSLATTSFLHDGRGKRKERCRFSPQIVLRRLSGTVRRTLETETGTKAAPLICREGEGFDTKYST